MIGSANRRSSTMPIHPSAAQIFQLTAQHLRLVATMKNISCRARTSSSAIWVAVEIDTALAELPINGNPAAAE